MNLTNFPNIIIGGVYYIIVGIMVFFSLFGVYILNRYGESKILALFVSAIYIVFFLTILTQSHNNLQNLL